jgi:phytoene dehydrogenase-like protein
MVPLGRRPTGALGIVLALLAHVTGWPVVKGGSQVLAEALSAHLRFLGGEVFTGVPIESIDDLPRARAYVFDVGPAQLARIAGHRLPAAYVRRLGRFRYGAGVFKLDFALDEPIPWNADECARAGTVHIGGSFEEIAAAEDAVAAGRHPERPFVILVQPTLFDPSRAPKGRHTAWAYCHVPGGSPFDMSARVEDQIERFAHGFKDRIIARHNTNAVQMEAYNANYVGGDINGGIQDMRQILLRPVARWDPYSTPNKSVFICSSSTPPGGGVHGMSGYLAARSALRRAFR